MNTKVCKKCGQIKDISKFPFTNREKNYRQSYCNTCINREKYLKRKMNIDLEHSRQRKKRLKTKYKLTIEDYNKILLEQNNKCKICNTDINNIVHSNKVLVVDHSHTTGKIRGLLCAHCNSLLGFAKDNITILKSAIKYLEE